jgi:hypothetical protein
MKRKSGRRRDMKIYATALALGVVFSAGGAFADDLPQEAVQQSGGAMSPPGGGRPDKQTPQLGTGNRGTGQEGALGHSGLDPGRVRSEAEGPAHVVGRVLMVRGDTYIVRQANGQEISLTVDRDTNIAGVVNLGERIEADIDAAGRVKEIRTK